MDRGPSGGSLVGQSLHAHGGGSTSASAHEKVLGGGDETFVTC